MSTGTLCRVCLASNVKMHHVANTEYQEIFEKLSTKLHTADGRPETMCYICFSHLHKCRRFIYKSRKAEEILSQFSLSRIQATHETVTKLNLKQPLSISPTQYLFVNDTTQDSFQATKEEASVKEEVIDNTMQYPSVSNANHDNSNITIKEEIIMSEYEEVTPKEETFLEIETESSVTYQECNLSSQCLTLEVDDAHKVLNELPSSTAAEQLEMTYCCKFCSMTFSVNCELALHIIESHNTQMPYNCSKIEKQFEGNSHLLVNRQAGDRDKSFYSCNLCNKQYYQKRSLNRHLKIHTGEKPYDTDTSYACTLCDKRFNRKENMYRHVVNVHKADKPPAIISEKQSFASGEKPYDTDTSYACTLCDKRFNRKEHMYRHVVNVHKADKPPAIISEKQSFASGEKPYDTETSYACTLCDKRFSRKENMYRHVVNVHKADKPPAIISEKQLFACSLCNRQFSRKQNLKRHLEAHTSSVKDTEKSYTCNLCDKQYFQKGSFNRHIKLHTSCIPHFICDYCNKQFGSKHHLIVHVRIHTGEKPYACNVCGKQFGKKYNMDIHLKTHSREKPYACGRCNERFLYENHLVIHQRTHTGGNVYSCDMCNKSFVKRRPLIVHLKTHTGEKPYACDVCDKKFSEKSNMDRHRKIHFHVETHSEEKPYACDVCNKQFAERHNMKRHRRTH